MSETNENCTEFRLHEGQLPAWNALFEEPNREVYLISGVQGGKTIFGSFATREVIENVLQPGENILIGAPTYKIMEQSTIQTFKKLHGPLLGEYNGKDVCYRMKDQKTVWFRTSTDPDSVEGIPDCVFAWIDEIGKCQKRFWVNALARLARRQGKLLGTTTWYALNWMYKDRWKPWKANELSDIAMHYFDSSTNPSFPKEEFERQKHLMSPQEFKRKFCGEPSKIEGIVWDVPGERVIAPKPLPNGTRYYAGVDWGYEHPFAMVIRAITPQNVVYEVSEFKRSHLDPSEKVEVAKAKMKQWNVERFYADPEDPAMIAAFNKAGIPTTAFHVGKENYKKIVPGISLHTQLIRSGKYFIFNTCEQLVDEYDTYHWEEESQERPEKPVDVGDDLMCAVRYVSVGTSHLLKERKELISLPGHIVIDTWKPGKERQKKNWAVY